MRVKVYLVDDHRLFLAGVRAELSEEFSIVGSAHDVDTAIEEIRGLEPDVVWQADLEASSPPWRPATPEERRPCQGGG